MSVKRSCFTPPASPYLVRPDSNFRLSDCATTPPEDAPSWTKLKKALHKTVIELDGLQRLLFSSPYSVLLVFQAMDAAGKDSTIAAVLSGVNPAGVQVYSFQQPSAEELAHDCLWRTAARMPERGRIGVFNRSYYEEVLVLRVHPEYLKAKQLARLPEAAEHEAMCDHQFWDERFESILDHEKHMARNGTIILKFMLNVSKEMQGRRLLRRIDDSTKNWKFSPTDLKERAHWAQYQAAYEQAIARTSTEHAPWYVVPADNKHFMKQCVADIVVRAIKSIQPSLRAPIVSASTLESLKDAKRQLVQELSADLKEARQATLARSSSEQSRRRASKLKRKKELEAEAHLEAAAAEGVHAEEEQHDDVQDSSDEVERHGIRTCVPNNWAQLSKEQRAAAKKLGYSCRAWDNHLETDIDDLMWNELSHGQRRSAKTLGIEHDTWDMWHTLRDEDIEALRVATWSSDESSSSESSEDSTSSESSSE
eukprot:TRINITY_DN20249_c0_g1_i2.p1 TRINITY_DN20249_c0_g1~~TRINITY_DN20249_c0_g1_i2.p1  ORF type:complete len:480 (+),score=119.03 TRINITY_DN20249_c0_g1_i2:174-1613(+)